MKKFIIQTKEVEKACNHYRYEVDASNKYEAMEKLYSGNFNKVKKVKTEIIEHITDLELNFIKKEK